MKYLSYLFLILASSLFFTEISKAEEAEEYSPQELQAMKYSLDKMAYDNYKSSPIGHRPSQSQVQLMQKKTDEYITKVYEYEQATGEEYTPDFSKYMSTPDMQAKTSSDIKNSKDWLNDIEGLIVKSVSTFSQANTCKN